MVYFASFISKRRSVGELPDKEMLESFFEPIEENPYGEGPSQKAVEGLLGQLFRSSKPYNKKDIRHRLRFLGGEIDLIDVRARAANGIETSYRYSRWHQDMQAWHWEALGRDPSASWGTRKPDGLLFASTVASLLEHPQPPLPELHEPNESVESDVPSLSSYAKKVLHLGATERLYTVSSHVMEIKHGHFSTQKLICQGLSYLFATYEGCGTYIGTFVRGVTFQVGLMISDDVVVVRSTDDIDCFTIETIDEYLDHVKTLPFSLGTSESPNLEDLAILWQLHSMALDLLLDMEVGTPLPRIARPSTPVWSCFEDKARYLSSATDEMTRLRIASEVRTELKECLANRQAATSVSAVSGESIEVDPAVSGETLPWNEKSLRLSSNRDRSALPSDEEESHLLPSGWRTDDFVPESAGLYPDDPELDDEEVEAERMEAHAYRANRAVLRKRGATIIQVSSDVFDALLQEAVEFVSRHRGSHPTAQEKAISAHE